MSQSTAKMPDPCKKFPLCHQRVNAYAGQHKRWEKGGSIVSCSFQLEIAGREERRVYIRVQGYIYIHLICLLPGKHCSKGNMKELGKVQRHLMESDTGFLDFSNSL